MATNWCQVCPVARKELHVQVYVYNTLVLCVRSECLELGLQITTAHVIRCSHLNLVTTTRSHTTKTSDSRPTVLKCNNVFKEVFYVFNMLHFYSK